MSSDAILIRKWLDSLTPLSESTLKQYNREGERFVAWLQARSNDLTSCNADDLNTYFGVLQHPPSDERSAFHVRRRKALSESSLRQSRRIVGLILSWATREEYMARNPFWEASSHWRTARRPQLPPAKSTPPREVILQAVATRTSLDESEESLRARVIAHLAFWSGAVSSEISDLKLGDVKGEGEDTFLCLPGADCASVQFVALPDATRHVIDAYVAVRAKRGDNPEGDAPLVASLRSGQKVSAWTIWHAVRSWDFLEDRPLAASPQQLRRAFQEAAVQGGAQEREVAKHLRRQGLPKLAVSPVQVNAKRLLKVVRRTLKDGAPRELNVMWPSIQAIFDHQSNL